jgi:hypothetical protein
MPNTIPAAGEATPNRDPMGVVMDAQDILSEIKNLNEAIYMAAHGLGDSHHMNAISTVANIIDQKLLAVEAMLDEARGAGE